MKQIVMDIPYPPFKVLWDTEWLFYSVVSDDPRVIEAAKELLNRQVRGSGPKPIKDDLYHPDNRSDWDEKGYG